MESDWFNSLKEKLDQHYAWPDLYTFKFIVPKAKVKEVTALFPHHSFTQRDSKNGNYVSVTFQMMMPSTESVIDVYVAASSIEGIVSL
jgi:uncharacterized protein